MGLIGSDGAFLQTTLLKHDFWAPEALYVYIYTSVDLCIHAQRMFVSELSATGIRDPAQLSVSE